MRRARRPTPLTTALRLTPAHPAPMPGYDGRTVIVGSGLAGLLTALDLAPQRPILVTAGDLGLDCASDLAQGGLAAAVGPDDDVERHAQDTLAAGAGLCDPQVVRAVTADGPAAVRRMLELGARLDYRADGSLDLGLEGAHSRHRIVHAAGDGSGHELTRSAVTAVEADPRITVLTQSRALRLLTDPTGAIAGIVLQQPGGLRQLATRHVVLATGGAGSLFRYTTNPAGARGTGLALGLRAGAAVRDVEFVQFHPTALDVALDPMPLVSEAVRGHGARLVDEYGARVVADELAPRDVVARAVWAALEQGRQVFLDTPNALGPQMAHEFPTVTAAARQAGIDPSTQTLPVRPAAHYHMGGLLVDLHGRTTVPGLWAVGEVASTGLHGANRLASNSLLEAIVCSRWVARDVAAHAGLRPLPARGSRRRIAALPHSAPPHSAEPHAASRTVIPHDVAEAALVDSAQPDPRARAVLSEAAGVLRDHRGLLQAVSELRDGAEANDMRLVALVLAWSAWQRTESRGGHTRTDYPERGPAEHTVTTLAAVLADTQDTTERERSA